jgi:hypothetical protein
VTKRWQSKKGEQRWLIGENPDKSGEGVLKDKSPAKLFPHHIFFEFLTPRKNKNYFKTDLFVLFIFLTFEPCVTTERFPSAIALSTPHPDYFISRDMVIPALIR